MHVAARPFAWFVARGVPFHDLTLGPCISAVPITCSFYGKARFNDNNGLYNGGAVLNRLGSLT